MKILVINSGSSSVKAQLIEMDTKEELANAYCERVGVGDSFMTYKKNGEKLKLEKDMPSHKEAFQFLLETLTDKELGVISSLDEIKSIGHRLVNFGEKYIQTTLVTPDVYEDLQNYVNNSPLHNKAALLGIKTCMELMPDKKNVAVFDTQFHATIPEKAFMYAIPYEYYEKHGVRKYGAHGTSHKFIAKTVGEIYGDLKGKKIISCHLGSGSSISAIKEGKCVDTTMGHTPLAGIIMGTRCGDIDPSVVLKIAEITGKDTKEVSKILNSQSGMYGITGGSSDMRDIENMVMNDDGSEDCRRAKLAFDMLVYSIKKYIGSYYAVMNGLDYLVFTAGIGEKSDMIREAVCSDMESLGIKIDVEKNRNLNKPFGDIVEMNSEDSKVKILRIPTNEELMIALETDAM